MLSVLFDLLELRSLPEIIDEYFVECLTDLQEIFFKEYTEEFRAKIQKKYEEKGKTKNIAEFKKGKFPSVICAVIFCRSLL